MIIHVPIKIFEVKTFFCMYNTLCSSYKSLEAHKESVVSFEITTYTSIAASEILPSPSCHALIFLLNCTVLEFLQNFSHLQKNTVYLYQIRFRYMNCLMSNRAADTAAGERVSPILLITLWQPHQMFTSSHSPSQITFKAEDYSCTTFYVVLKGTFCFENYISQKQQATNQKEKAILHSCCIYPVCDFVSLSIV